MFDPKKLADARKKNELSQTEAADKLGTTRQTISSWERGEYEPDTDKLHEMAKLYGVSVADFFTDDHDVPDGNIISTKPMSADSGKGDNKKSRSRKKSSNNNLKMKLRIAISICVVFCIIAVVFAILYFTRDENELENVNLRDMDLQIIDMETEPDGRFELFL